MDDRLNHPAGTDSGLLAPVWAGTRAAAATTDEAWLRALLDVETALARAQARVGIVPETAARAIAAAAQAPLDLAALAQAGRGAANPVVELVRQLTAAVAAADRAAAGYVHHGATSQDIMDTAAVLVARRAVEIIRADLDRTATALAGLADRHRHTVMAARTLTQHAVPTTFGLKAAGWLTLVLDAEDQLRALVADRLPAQLGGAGGTLAAYQELARGAGVDALALSAAFAAELGLPEPVVPWHVTRTPIVALGDALAFTAGALAKFALDVQVLARTEVAEVAEPAAAGRGVSSALPHKRNPVLSTLIVAAGRQVPAYRQVLSAGLLAEDERPAGAWQAEWQPLRECLRLTGGAAQTAAELARGLVVHPGQMRANLALTGGNIVAERVCAALAPVIGRQPAQRLLAAATATAAANRQPLARVLAAAPELRAADLSGLSLAELCEPDQYLGAAGALVDRVLARYAGH